MPKVSVIIPIYNVEHYLRQSLDSAVNQTLEDIEIICIDDGSTDGSSAIAAEYAQRYDNIRLIRQENQGLSNTRNTGLDIATGEYILFLDSDDALDLCAAESLYQTAAAAQLDILLFNTGTHYHTPELAQARYWVKDHFFRDKDYSGLCTGQSMFARLFPDDKFLTTVWLNLFRREFLQAHGLRFYPGIYYEDLPFVFKAMMLAQRVDYVPDRFYLRIVREQSITTSPKTMRHVEGFAAGYYEVLTFLQGIPLQADAAALIGTFLEKEFCRSMINFWKKLPEEEQDKPLQHGGVCAAHLLEQIKRSYRTEQRLHRRIDELTAQRDRLQQQTVQLKQRLQHSQQGKFRRLLNSLRARGLSGTFRRLWEKVRSRFSRH